MTHVFATSAVRRMATGLAGLMLLGLCAPVMAAAQDTPPPSGQATGDQKPGDQQTEDQKPDDTVTVKGKKPQNRIDRQVYDAKNDIDAASGTASDVLNKVPSVNVDSDGNVTLRGKSDVQVYVDGKPSAMMKGDNRAATLQSLQGSDIDSVEVMNNPGAQFSADGGGGIINLVLKKNRKPGTSGAIIANAGSQGRYNASASVSRNSGKLTLSGGGNFRHDSRDSRGTSSQTVFDSNGNVVSQRDQAGVSQNGFDTVSLNGGIDYTIDDTDSVSTQLAYGRRTFDSTSVDTYSGASLSGNLPYTRTSDGGGKREDVSGVLHWDHKGDQPAETLKFDLRYSTSNGDNHSVNVNDLADNTTYPDYTDTKASVSRTANGVFSVDYARNVGETGQLTLGTQTTYDDNHFVNASTSTAVTPGNAQLNNDFAYQQVVNAAYVTYQQSIGEDWVFQGGLRAEALDLNTHLAGGVAGHTTDTKLVPSAFASYTINDNAKLRFAYSHRLRRPNPQDLNPSIVFFDAQNVSRGNPDLKPSESDSFEVGYEYAQGQTSWQLRGYYRKSVNQVTDISTVYAPGVLLTTKVNAGDGQSGGLEFNYNGKLGQKLTLSLNGNASYDELTTPVTGKASGTSLRGRVSFDYQATPNDRVQLGVFSSGRQLTGQGYRSPFSMGNLSYSHTLNPKLKLNVSVSDPFRTGKFHMVTSTPTLYSETTRNLQAPTFYVGLSYTLGGAPAKDQDGRGEWRGRGGGGWGGPGGGMM